MRSARDTFVSAQLRARRTGRVTAFAEFGKTAQLLQLLEDVDLARLCLSHLTSAQRRALEQDLDLASRIQTAMLPMPHLVPAGGEVYDYYPRFRSGELFSVRFSLRPTVTSGRSTAVFSKRF